MGLREKIELKFESTDKNLDVKHCSYKIQHIGLG